jgi:hypothetical protein
MLVLSSSQFGPIADIARALPKIMSELETPQQHGVASGFVLSETLGSSSGTAFDVLIV